MTDTPSTTSGAPGDPRPDPPDEATGHPDEAVTDLGPTGSDTLDPPSADAPTSDVPAPDVSGATVTDSSPQEAGTGEVAAVPQPGQPVVERTDLRAVLAGHDDPNARDHVALTAGVLAGLTDRGLRRRRNEDALALGRLATTVGDLFVAAVCDGVASARRGDEASLAAVEAAVDAVLTVLVPEPGGMPDPTGPLPAPAPHELDALAGVAADAGAAAAADLGRDAPGRDTPGGDTPACTYVGAVALRADAVVSWVGDSRIYWLAEDGSSRLLTVDDSWAEEIAAAGLMPREQAFHDRRAHVLTRWMGFDSPSEPARSRRVRVASPGMLMLCSDGIWNHLPDAEVLADLVRGLGPEDAAAALVRAAIDDGGHDNATVALVPLFPDDDPDTDGIRIDARFPEERTGPIPIGGDGGRGES